MHINISQEYNMPHHPHEYDGDDTAIKTYLADIYQYRSTDSENSSDTITVNAIIQSLEINRKFFITSLKEISFFSQLLYIPYLK